MWFWVALAVMAAILIPAIVCRKKPVSFEMEKRGHPLKLFYPLAEKLIRMADCFRSQEIRKKEQEQYRQIYVGSDALQKGRTERVKRTAICLFLSIILCLLCMLTEAGEWSKEDILRENTIERPKKGEGDTTVQLEWETEAQSGKTGLKVKEQRLAGEEKEELFLAGEEYAKGLLQGTNDNLLSLQGDVVFAEELPGTELRIECRPASYRWWNPDGSRTLEPVPEDGAEEEIIIRLSYYEEEREKKLTVRLIPGEDKEESFVIYLENFLAELQSDNTEATIELPETLAGTAVSWGIAGEAGGWQILLSGAAAVIYIVRSGKRTLVNEVKKREKELLEDYPELVAKFLLLLSAGLTIRAVWERITDNYLQSNHKRYVYEEMLITRREIENGVSERKAYEHFGKRCHLLPFLRFSSVLVQNLRKGSNKVLEVLEQEASAAFAERKENAKQLGEEAGTKLLLPMAGMLGVVLVIIMFPALRQI